jgi:cyclopropane fatty-acyl-phospholipid synthase-like methyltransferase
VKKYRFLLILLLSLSFLGCASREIKATEVKIIELRKDYEEFLRLQKRNLYRKQRGVVFMVLNDEQGSYEYYEAFSAAEYQRGKVDGLILARKETSWKKKVKN